MTGIRKNIWKYLGDRAFRREYATDHARSGVAYQIKAMREKRGWSQAELANKANKSQSNIARLENPDYGKFSIQTLLEMADTFDVWLSVQFVSFSEGLRRTEKMSPASLNVNSYDDELKVSTSTGQPSSSSIPPIQLTTKADLSGGAIQSQTESSRFFVAPI